MRFSRYEIRPDLCRACGACAKVCPKAAIDQDDERRFVIIQERCDGCGTCAGSCKLRSVVKRKGLFH